MPAGRPPEFDEAMIRTIIQLPADVLEKLKKKAEKKRTSVAKVIRQSVIRDLEKERAKRRRPAKRLDQRRERDENQLPLNGIKDRAA